MVIVAKEWFTVDEAAQYLSVSRRTIYKLVQEDRLPAFRVGKERHRRFRKEDLDGVLTPLHRQSKAGSMLGLSAAEDPVLADLWNNDRDAAYDDM